MAAQRKKQGTTGKAEREAKIEALLSELTLEEKTRLIHGAEFFRSGEVKRLGIPKITMSDGPMGVRNEFLTDEWKTVGTTADYVSYLPSNSALAATWNRELARSAGQSLGKEARGRGKDMILAPGINVKRNPLCGRNFEYLSEDPYLISEMVVPLIEGIQEYDVSACVKHFACNAQETERLWVNVDLSERALREIYLPGFEAAVKRAKTHALMGSYNLVRGEHGSQSRHLLTKILRDEWKYDGLVVSDWGAIHETKAAAESGLDLEMSITADFDEYFLANPLIRAVKNGEISEEEIDKKVRNILRFMLRVRMIEIELKKTRAGKRSAVAVAAQGRNPGAYNTIETKAAALAVAREAVVLLKNERGRLPILPEKTKRLLVIGDNANRMHANGGGSAEIKALYEITPLMGLAKVFGGNTQVDYLPGYYVPAKMVTQNNWQEDSVNVDPLLDASARDGRKNSAEEKKKIKALREEAVRLAKEYDEVIIVGGLNHDYDVEGMDRADMKLPYEQDALISAVLEAKPGAVVVMVAGSPVDMTAWKDKAKAILWMSYNGMEGGTALAEVVAGYVNPSGKLPESLPVSYKDTPVAKYGDYPGRKLTAAEKKRINAHLMQTFREGVFVGYRYYDKAGTMLQYPFGHGLSYTAFEYGKITTKSRQGKPEAMEISISIRNKGNVAGAEVVQLYVGPKKHSEQDPLKELKGFEKVFLRPGQEKTVRFKLDAKAFSHYDEEKGTWVQVHGAMNLYIGSSSADIRAKKTVTV